MDREYQKKHSLFVSNHTGSSPEIILLANSIVPISSLLLRLGIMFLPLKEMKYKICVEIAVAVVPMVLAFTVWSSRLPVILFILGVICIILHTTKSLIRKKNENKQSDCRHTDDRISHGNRFFAFLEAEVLSEKIYKLLLTEYRSHMLLSTAVCILAVDFPIFPRYFAKTEVYGWSLMDVGVGCFVIANGIVSGQASGKVYSNKVAHIHSAFTANIPMILIGIIRLIATRSTGYHEHVSEYGIHWNFFITFALTKIICTGIHILLPSINCGVLSFIIISFYQYLLTFCGMSEYLFSSERRNIIQANKEGIYSLIGYISVYFAGVELGTFLSRKRATLREWIKALFLIVGIGYFSWIMMHLVCSNIENVSRRTTNLAYFLWMLSFNCYEIALHLFGLLIMEVQHIKAAHSLKLTSRTHLGEVILWNAINGNALFYFLFANVITGIINLSLQTIYTSTTVSLLIILVYATMLSLCTVFLYINSIKTKIW